MMDRTPITHRSKLLTFCVWFLAVVVMAWAQTNGAIENQGNITQQRHLGPAPDVMNTARDIRKAVATEKLRALPDNDPALALLFRERMAREAVGASAGSPEMDMIEREMWRRGDATIAIVQKMFREPFVEDIPNEICLWLRYRPWMKPEEFLPLARTWFAENNDPSIPEVRRYSAHTTVARFLAMWGEPEDEKLLIWYFDAYQVDERLRNEMLTRFRERQILRAKGTPRALPEWFFEPGEIEFHPTTVPDRTKTYAEMKAQVGAATHPPAVEAAVPAVSAIPAPSASADKSHGPAVKPAEESSGENHGPPWIMLGASVAVLLALLVLQARTRRGD